MNHYCTYFDLGYAAQGTAMWHSLARHDPAAELTVLALDAETRDILRAFGDRRLQIIDLNELLAGNPDLERVRANRSHAEFIFALTPCLLRQVFLKRPDIDRLAYLDADVFFFSAPTPIWEGLAENTALIVPHRFPHWHDDSQYYGRYNVGVVNVRRTEAGLACLDWWRERCLASTTLAADGERYGDQKYLDAWRLRFAGVVESSHPGVNLAPWNWAGHRITLEDDGVQVDGAPLVVFHFAQFRRISDAWFDSGQLEYGIMSRTLRSLIYGEYWAALHEAERTLKEVRPGFAIPERGWAASLGPWHLALLRVSLGQFWHRRGRRFTALGTGLGRWSGHLMGWYRRRQRRSE